MTIEAKIALDEADRKELGSLAEACSAYDGEASIELEKSLNAHKDMPSFFLARDGESGPGGRPRLVGILSIFAPRSEEAELGAIVLPGERRRGAFRALLAEAERAIAAFRYTSELFVVDSRSEAGKAAALSLGAAHEYSELAMRYEGASPFPGPESAAAAALRPGLRLSRLGRESIGELAELRMEAFGDSREEAEDFERSTFDSADREEYGILLSGRLVAAASLGYEGERVSINGLVVAEAERGKGLGQAFLAELLRLLSGRGIEIVLDVNSRNEVAYHVYGKLGFAARRRVDYYRRGLPPA